MEKNKRVMETSEIEFESITDILEIAIDEEMAMTMDAVNPEVMSHYTEGYNPFGAKAK